MNSNLNSFGLIIMLIQFHIQFYALILIKKAHDNSVLWQGRTIQLATSGYLIFLFP